MSHISEPTVRRLSHYYRVLEEVAAEGKRMISSHLARRARGHHQRAGAQDSSSFGPSAGAGSATTSSTCAGDPHAAGARPPLEGLRRGSGPHRQRAVGYQGFADQGFDIVAVFDADADRVGRTVEGLVVRPMAQLSARDAFEIGVIATPARAAQPVADALVAAGVQGVLNFAPRKLRVPDGIMLRNVDMTMEFESLSYALTRTTAARPRRKRTRRAP
jgi:redox-sensing transcriptional repressor